MATLIAEDFNNIARLNILETAQANTALKAFFHFSRIIFKSFQ